MTRTIDLDIISRLILFAIESKHLLYDCVSTLYIELDSSYQLILSIEQLNIDFPMTNVSRLHVIILLLLLFLFTSIWIQFILVHLSKRKELYEQIHCFVRIQNEIAIISHHIKLRRRRIIISLTHGHPFLRISDQRHFSSLQKVIIRILDVYFIKLISASIIHHFVRFNERNSTLHIN